MLEGYMNISQVSEVTALSAKSIRLYEDKGIISVPNRAVNGYRVYGEKHITELNIVAKARSAGFSLEECKSLVKLAANPCRQSAEVKDKARKKLREVDQKIQDLMQIKNTLEVWIEKCPGDESSECPIIESLTEER